MRQRRASHNSYANLVTQVQIPIHTHVPRTDVLRNEIKAYRFEVKWLSTFPDHRTLLAFANVFEEEFIKFALVCYLCNGKKRKLFIQILDSLKFRLREVLL